MGLDTSHDCWHGPYSSFHEFRKVLCRRAGLGELKDYIGFGGDKAWPCHELTPLLSHSDCDGTLSPHDAQLVAAGLRALLPKLPDTWVLQATEQWIKGLELAATRNEPIDFH